MNQKIQRGAAIRAQKRNRDDAARAISAYADAGQKPRRKANAIANIEDKLKITFLGGQDGIGEKNMQVIEWRDQAVVLDCGIDLSVDLPGVNYAIADPAYLQQIRHKVKGYVISHGHLDHIGGLKHIVPLVSAPIFGSRFTIGIVEKTFEDAAAESGAAFKPKTVIMDMDKHERLPVGDFTLELVRVTHSVPESSLIVVDTPAGRIINTGDFRLDPEPLDNMPSDITRLCQLGDEGVLALLSESTYADIPGRQLTEHTLQTSFSELIDAAEGRVMVSIFSSNMNRVQMIVNAAVAAKRRIALDGRSMLAYAEIAIRQGVLKIPKGTVVPMGSMANLPANQVLVICTGGQGEPGSALQRMADGEHKHVTLKAGDTVVISSNPIPGNEIRYQNIGNQLALQGVHLFRNMSHEVDGCGPLHVGGHARRDEHREMLQLIRPKFFVPIYAGALNRAYHGEIAVEEGIPRKNVLQAANGDSLFLDAQSAQAGGQVPHGSLLIDQKGSPVNGIVVKDRLVLSEEGMLAVIVTVDKKSGQLLTSPDIISRGFIALRDNEELIDQLRAEIRRAVQQRIKRIDLNRFKTELRDHVGHFLHGQTGNSPTVITVVNVVGTIASKREPGKRAANGLASSHQSATPKAETAYVEQEQRRFQEMRARLLG